MKVERIPSWYFELQARLNAMETFLESHVSGWQMHHLTITPQDKGYTSGLATAAIQSAIDHAASLGGGTVLLANGDYVTGTLVLRSNVRLMIGEGSRLLASTDLADFPEHICQRVTVQFCYRHIFNSFVFYKKYATYSPLL